MLFKLMVWPCLQRQLLMYARNAGVGRRRSEASPGALLARAPKVSQGEIVDSQADQASGKPSAAPVKGKGKSSSGSDSTQPSRKGNGDKPPSQAADPDAAMHNAEWTLVTRRAKDPEGEFQLRARCLFRAWVN